MPYNKIEQENLNTPQIKKRRPRGMIGINKKGDKIGMEYTKHG